jgi:hypothetical protein
MEITHDDNLFFSGCPGSVSMISKTTSIINVLHAHFL